MTHGSIFTGLGGFDLAAAWLGWENIFQCEINPFCQTILKYHFPKTILYDDIKKTDFTKHAGTVDVLSGGFPCQPFSQAGQRKGAADNRYLWNEMFRAIREVRPSWAVAENVTGITSMVFPGSEIKVESETALFEEDYIETALEEKYIIEQIMQDFESIKYSVQPIIIPSCGVGAPHRRDRVWIVANRANTGLENLQRKRKDGICQLGDASDAERLHAKRCGYGETGKANGEAESKRDVAGNRLSVNFSSEGTIADANSQLQRKRNSNNVRKMGQDNVFKLLSCANAADATSSRRIQNNKRKSSGQSEQDVPDWRNFPTQPPVCGRNDGFSDRLDGISFPSWRRKSIEAYGNAIVPQVAYEIFKNIEKVENLKIAV